jgi:hypothetical protein
MPHAADQVGESDHDIVRPARAPRQCASDDKSRREPGGLADLAHPILEIHPDSLELSVVEEIVVRDDVARRF